MKNVQRLSREGVGESPKQEVFIYLLICPIKNTIKYVGQTTNPEKRFCNHLREALVNVQFREYHSPKCVWIRSLFEEYGLAPKFKIIKSYPKRLANLAEAYWMNYYLMDNKLLNNIFPKFKNFKKLYEFRKIITERERLNRSKAMRKVKSYPISGTDKHGKVYKFNSLVEAAEAFGIPYSNIIKCMKGERKSAGGLK